MDQIGQPEPVFADDGNVDLSDLFGDARQRELETNQIEEQFGPLNYDPPRDDQSLPILFSDKRIDVKKPGPRIDVSSS